MLPGSAFWIPVNCGLVNACLQNLITAFQIDSSRPSPHAPPPLLQPDSPKAILSHTNTTHGLTDVCTFTNHKVSRSDHKPFLTFRPHTRAGRAERAPPRLPARTLPPRRLPHRRRAPVPEAPGSCQEVRVRLPCNPPGQPRPGSGDRGVRPGAAGGPRAVAPGAGAAGGGAENARVRSVLGCERDAVLGGVRHGGSRLGDCAAHSRGGVFGIGRA